MGVSEGVSIPNRPTYRSNPKETKENQRQVESLMEKGWVRESLSPCAMPIVLVNQTISQLLRCLVGNNLKAKQIANYKITKKKKSSTSSHRN